MPYAKKSKSIFGNIFTPINTNILNEDRKKKVYFKTI